MKRLLMALILSLVLIVTFAAPAFAWGPPDPPDIPEPGLEGIYKAGAALAYRALPHIKHFLVPWNCIFNKFLGTNLPSIYY